jgi:hypothetical protein
MSEGGHFWGVIMQGIIPFTLEDRLIMKMMASRKDLHFYADNEPW